MKTIFTLLASLILSVSVFAAETKPKSMLTIRSSDMSNMRVVLDGKRFESGSNTVSISDLSAGFHTIKVYRQKTNGGLFGVLGMRSDVLYNSSVNLRPGTLITITIDRFGRASTQESKIRGGGRFDRDRNDQYGRDGNFDFDRDGQWGDYNDDRGNNYGHDDRGNNYGHDISRGMDDRDFRQVVQSISKEWLETNKLKSASQVVQSNSLTAAQVKQLVLLFNFEANKLDLAKQAYMNTVDKKNYYMINDVFSFNSSKDELARFIRSCE